MIDNQLIKVLKNVEIIATIGIGIALFFKIFQIPFAGPLIVVFVPTLAMIYMYGGLILFKNKISDTENKVLLIATGIVSAIGLIGITFKLMYWPFATNMLLVATILLPIIICIAVYLKFSSSGATQGDYNGFFLRVGIIYVFAALLYLTPNSALIAFQYRGDDERIRIMTQRFEHPENKEYRKEYDDYMKSKREQKNSTDSIK